MNVCHNWNYFIDLFTCLPYIPNVTVNSLESGNISVLFTIRFEQGYKSDKCKIMLKEEGRGN